MTATDPAASTDGQLLRTPILALVGLALVACGLIVPLTPPVNPDISWLSYAAGHYLGGGVPYVDLIEINPPAILFFNLPAAWLSSVTGWNGPTTYTVYVAAMGVASVAATRRLLVPLFGDGSKGLDLLTLLLMLVLFTMAGRNFGQREHVMLMLAFPYLVAAAVRSAGHTVPTITAIGVGLLAGVGLSLKPHFLVVWLAVELLLWTRARGRGISALRPENFIVAAVLGTYLLAILILTPRFFPMADALGGAYLGYLNGSLRDHFGQPAVLFVAVAVVAAFLAPLRAPWKALAEVLSVSAVAMLVMAAVQLKGWSYHYFPAFATAILLLGLVAVTWRRRPGLDPAGVTRLAAGGTLVLGVAGALVALPGILADSRGRLERLESVTDRIVQICGRSPSLVVFSPDAEAAFPLVTREDFRWAMPISSLWPLSAVYEEQARGEEPIRWHDGDEAPPAERFVRDRVVSALVGRPPDLLLVDRRASRRAFGSDGFGYVDYFAREPEFRALLRRYRPAGEWSGYRAWVDARNGTCAGRDAGADA